MGPLSKLVAIGKYGANGPMVSNEAFYSQEENNCISCSRHHIVETSIFAFLVPPVILTSSGNFLVLSLAKRLEH